MVVDAFQARSAELDAADRRAAEDEPDADEDGLMQLMESSNFKAHWRQEEVEEASFMQRAKRPRPISSFSA